VTPADWSREGRDWPNREASVFIEAGGFRFHVQLLGEGPVLLLLHGTGAATHSWRDLAPLLARDFLVVAPDLPGHGFSGPPRSSLTIEIMAAATRALLDRLGLLPGLIVGHSAGAAIGARMLIEEPGLARGLVSLNGALLPFPGVAAELFPGLARLLFLNPFTPRLFALQSGFIDPARFLQRSTGSRIDARGVRHYARLFGRPGHVSAALEMMANWDLKALKRDLPRLACPLLLVAGSNDLAVPAASVHEVAALVPGATIEILSGLGHLAHEEAPEQVATLIGRFAESVRAREEEA